MKLSTIDPVTTQDQARQLAIDWQSQAGKKSLSYAELAAWAGFFRKLGKRFGLLKEFKENGII
jgi:hypothetical protein